MFGIDDIAKGLSSGTIEGIAKAADTLIKNFKASPEQLAQWEQTKLELEARLKDIEQKGIDSARQREMAVKDNVPATLAYTALGVFSGLAGLAMFIVIPPANHDIVIAMLSWFGGFVSSSFLYYFGTSAGSKSKDAVIAAFNAKLKDQ